MPSLVHEIAVSRLSRDPSLLPALAEKLLGRPPPRAQRPIDAALRLANPVEIRPDLVLAGGKRGPWDAVEVQRRIDRRKARRWPLLVSLLHDQRRAMGDLWVLTAARSTAAWARKACDVAGPHGTRMRVEPVVLLLGPEQIGALLDEEQPRLAFFAAWAMQHRHGPAAGQVIERALAITGQLPQPLRRTQGRDILDVLNRRLLDTLKEKLMEETSIPLTPWAEEVWELMESVGEAKWKREALLVVLQGRRLPPSRAERALILACTDRALLDAWLAGSGQATSVTALLAERPSPNARPKPPIPVRPPRRASPRQRAATTGKPVKRSRAG